MNTHLLDHDTADRLLSGTMRADDAPPGYAVMATKLDELRELPVTIDAAREADAVAAVLAGVRSGAPVVELRRRSLLRLTKSKVAAIAIAGGLTLSTGVAAAALPGAASDTARSMLSHLGITVKGPNSHSNGHADTRGKSGDHSHGANAHDASHSSANANTGAEANAHAHAPNTPNGGPPSTTKGQQISNLSHTTDATGADKGAQISTAANEGHSQASDHGNAGHELNGTGQPPERDKTVQSGSDQDGVVPPTGHASSQGLTHSPLSQP